jgi:hypothetical protein
MFICFSIFLTQSADIFYITLEINRIVAVMSRVHIILLLYFTSSFNWNLLNSFVAYVLFSHPYLHPDCMYVV